MSKQPAIIAEAARRLPSSLLKPTLIFAFSSGICAVTNSFIDSEPLIKQFINSDLLKLGAYLIVGIVVKHYFAANINKNLTEIKNITKCLNDKIDCIEDSAERQIHREEISWLSNKAFLTEVAKPLAAFSPLLIGCLVLIVKTIG